MSETSFRISTLEATTPSRTAISVMMRRRVNGVHCHCVLRSWRINSQRVFGAFMLDVLLRAPTSQSSAEVSYSARLYELRLLYFADRDYIAQREGAKSRNAGCIVTRSRQYFAFFEIQGFLSMPR